MEEVEGNKAVRVYFLDGRYKSILCSEESSTAEIFDNACKHINLELRALFSLWVSGNGLEFPLKDDEKPIKVLTNWSTIRNEYTYVNDDEDRRKRLPVFEVPRLQLRMRGILDKHLQIKDPAAIMLVYVECMYCVINSLYNCTVEDAIYLAGLQCKIMHGTFDGTVHKPGFLKADLSLFVPKLLYSKLKPKQWEVNILNTFREQKADQPEHISQLLYISRCRRFPNYGGKFFWGCRLGKVTKMYYEKNIPNFLKNKKVALCINQGGVYVFSPVDMEELTFYPYHSIVSWDVEGSNFLIEVQTGRATSREFVFETAEAPIMDDLMVEQVQAAEKKQEEIENSIRNEKKALANAKAERDKARAAQRSQREKNALRSESKEEGENLFLPKTPEQRVEDDA